MVTIPILNVPTYTPDNKVDFGMLGDLENTYRTAQAAKLKQQQDAQAQALAQQGYAASTGQPQPPPPQPPGGGSWLSGLQQLFQPQQPQPPPQSQPQPQPQAALPASSALPPSVANANANAFAGPPQQDDIVNTYGRQTSNAESGGPDGNYRLVGPSSRTGDRAYGRFQVMGANVGDWTEKYYGERLTPREFVLNPEAQDAVYRGEFGRLAGKYGPEGAHRAWFAGERNMNNPNASDGYHNMAWYMAKTGQASPVGAARALGYADAGDRSEGDAAAAVRAVTNIGNRMPQPNPAAAIAPTGPAPTGPWPQPQGATATIPPGTGGGPVNVFDPRMYGQNEQGQPPWAYPDQPINLPGAAAAAAPVAARPQAAPPPPPPQPLRQPASARRPPVTAEDDEEPTAAAGQGPIRKPSGMSPELFGALYANPNTRPMAAAILTQQLTPKDVEIKEHDGRYVLINKQNPELSRELPFDLSGGSRPATAQEKVQYGVAPDAPLVFDNGKPRILSAGGVNVTTQAAKLQTEEEKYRDQYFGKFAENIIKEGAGTRESMQMLQEMNDLGHGIGTGPSAALQGWLSDNGLKFGSNIDKIEAYKTITNKLTPAQRIPGSGSTSDFEEGMYRRSLPQLMNTEGGNDIIHGTMMAKEQDKQARSDIMQDYLAGGLTKMETVQKLRALPSPYENFKNFLKTRRLGVADPVVQAKADQMDAKSGKLTRGQLQYYLDQARSFLTMGHPKGAVYEELRKHVDDTDIPLDLKPSPF